MQYLRGMFGDVGLEMVIKGNTISLEVTNKEGVILTPEQLRGDEIKVYVAEVGEGLRWVAVDDMDLCRELEEDNFVRTNVESGLSSKNVNELIEKLSNK